MKRYRVWLQEGQHKKGFDQFSMMLSGETKSEVAVNASRSYPEYIVTWIREEKENEASIEEGLKLEYL